MLLAGKSLRGLNRINDQPLWDAASSAHGVPKDIFPANFNIMRNRTSLSLLPLAQPSFGFCYVLGSCLLRRDAYGKLKRFLFGQIRLLTRSLISSTERPAFLAMVILHLPCIRVV